ncbi:MAG: Metal dependent phosphohydrolase [Parcubacteria group bacterium GW2011_GWC1_41_7]|nr:MAG: Metal dependent phosphohydrolase [Parcubacteria group bacterium GW2011_GWC1_41_7]
MEKKKNIDAISKIVKKESEAYDPGHDWFHIERVLRLSRKIQKQEGGDLFVIELAALLHDVADWKFFKGKEDDGVKKIKNILHAKKIDLETTSRVCGIIKNLSFKGEGVKDHMSALEGKIVQDADRLDAIGAIGIARTFSYGGYKKNSMYDPRIKPMQHKTKQQYKKSTGTTINHFYEKLLLLKDRMHTKTAKEMAKSRHAFMKFYLSEFLKEWRGN